ncbi:MAG: alpha/beta hydrolase [Candidatus Koribacter versatilis]|uniref:Alpha/beta hydrolase n=1 Tax=Candidatus Korobacter versatilis TaxID=658062 RepID=A0A932ENB1_9BACT|nr:alpha/beta hydrolase [Candidatus Koribacter versatilis]
MPAIVERVADTARTPAVRGFLHRPERPCGDALILTHGAGGNANAPLLIALAEAFAATGLTVLRCDLPYRQARPHGPPRGNGAEDREGLRRAAEFCRSFMPGRMFLGGASYGGRQATMLAAEDPKVCDGLLVLSYPLHPPGRPGQLRTKHLPSIHAPVLFISGSKDPFGAPAELEAAVRLVPTKPRLLIVEGAGHDLGFSRAAKKKAAELPQQVLSAFRETVTPKCD